MCVQSVLPRILYNTYKTKIKNKGDVFLFMAENQELRQALNKIEITGVVKESKLQSGKTDDGKYINGSIIIKAGQFTELELKVFANEKSKEGKVRKVYTTLKQILDKEFQTLADGASEEDAVKIRVWGNDGFTPQFREEMYVTDNNKDETTTRISVDLGFGNVTIANDTKPEDYKATFDVEMFIAKIEEEVKNQEETGRVIVKGYVPVYGGEVIPLTVIAGIVVDDEGEFNFGEQIRNEISEGSTINLWGDIDFKSIITKTEKGGSLGRAKIEEKREYVHDLVATGGDIVDDPDDEFDEDLIRQACGERKNKMDEVLQESKKEGKNKGKGDTKGGKGLTGGKDKEGNKRNKNLPF